MTQSRGMTRERQLVHWLEERGWFAMRSPASKGVADIVAVRPGPIVWFIEVKATAVKGGPYQGFGPDARDRLREVAEAVDAVPYLCWWPPRCLPQFFPAEVWPG